MSSLIHLDDKCVNVIELPAYSGGIEYLLRRRKIKKIISDIASPGRIPGQIVEDPLETLFATAFRHPLALTLQYVGKKCSQRATQFDISNMTKGYLKVYRELAEEKSRSLRK